MGDAVVNFAAFHWQQWVTLAFTGISLFSIFNRDPTARFVLLAMAAFYFFVLYSGGWYN